MIIGIQRILTTTKTTTNNLNKRNYSVEASDKKKNSYFPTISCSKVEAFERNLSQISIVNKVLALLNMDVRELINADIITANIKPRAPEIIEK